MDAIELLTSRTSCPFLEAPGPTDEQLEIMLRAAQRAPDHKALKPYRFLKVTPEGQDKLSDLFEEILLAEEPDADERTRNKVRKMPHRAPTLLVAIAVTQEHPKVPVSEQIITAGCATHAIVQAAFAQGLGAIWRSSNMAYDPKVAKALNLADNEQVIGYIYLGQPARVLTAPDNDPTAIVQDWP